MKKLDILYTTSKIKRYLLQLLH